MSKPLSKRAHAFLKYVEDQNLGRIEICFIDGSTRAIEPLVKRGFLRKEPSAYGHKIVITDDGREALRR